ncbi:MAG TPA: SagB family peptide dehydrogenase [Clostridia bacterium]|nr:SagB family peptide dehydrogenase [Clostridia bacterium]
MASEKMGEKDKEKNKKVKMSIQEFQQREMGPIWEIFDFAANIPVSIYTESTAVKLPEMCYRGALISENRFFSEEYLLNSKRCSIDMALPLGVFSYASLATRGSLSFRHFLEEEEHDQEDNTIELPDYMKVKTSLDVLVRSRRSIREMTGRRIKLEELSTILFYANGTTGDFNHAPEGAEFAVTESLGSRYVSKVRTAPSGGGLYPIYLYVVIQNVEKLEDGIYKYMPLTHSLKKVKLFDERDKGELYTIANWGRNIELPKLNMIIFYVYNLYENSRKYVDMGLTFGLIEAGEISQNIHLACTGLNLASCDIGGYDKVPCEKLIGVDGLTKHIIHLTVIGE